MVSGGVACDGYIRRCKELHQSKEKSPVSRFFKVMFGRDYENVLYLPPKFARTVQHLADQETQIEDVNGKQWSVTLSNVKGSLAFQKGWHKFLVDHGLKQGELVIFKYIEGSHFFVRIFGKSAVERVNFNIEMPRPNKRPRRGHVIASEDEPIRNVTNSEDEPIQTAALNSRDKPTLAAPVSAAPEFHTRQTNLEVKNVDSRRIKHRSVCMNMEDTTCMINRNNENFEGEDRNFLYDLSCFEMQNRTSDQSTFHAVPSTKLDPSGNDAEQTKTRDAEQTETRGDNAMTGVIHKSQIQGHSGDMFIDKSEKVVKGLSDDIFNVESEKALEPKSHSGDMFIDKSDKFKVMNQVKGLSSDISNVKSEKALESKSHSGDMFIDKSEKFKVMNQVKGLSDDILNIKSEKASESKRVPAETTNQTLKKGETQKGSIHSRETQKGLIHSSQTAGHSINAIKFSMKPPENINLSKRMLNDVSNAQNGSRVKFRPRDSPVPIDPSSKHGIKKEREEFGDEANGFTQVSSEFFQKIAGKQPATLRSHGQMLSPAVKIEPDQSYDVDHSFATAPFTAEVKSTLYLELPAEFPQLRARKDRGKGRVVFLKDSTGRVLPVFHPYIFGFRALTDHWEFFCKENSIKPGDKCRFSEVENGAQCIFRVDVICRSGESPNK